MINHPHRSKKTKAEKAIEVVVSYKGFDKNMRCRGFQFEVGKQYTVGGKTVACENGFHACENPMDVWGYYAPGDNRFALVEQSGDLARHEGDSKIASAHITIKAELSLPDFIKRGVDYLLAQVNWEGAKESNTGEYGVALASGYKGRVSGADGCALFLVERADDYKILSAWSGIVGRDGIKPEVFYVLKDGKPVEWAGE